MRKRWIVILISTVIILACTCVSTIPTPSAPPTLIATSTQYPLSRQEPPPTQEPTITPIATETQEVSEPGLIPGLERIDVELNLEERDFTCELVYMPDEQYPEYKWECRDEATEYYMLVEIWSRSYATVDLLQCEIVQYGTPDEALAASFLGFMATMPYDGAEPDKARSWVEATLPTITASGDVRKKTFGGVKFQLFGDPTFRELDIGTDISSQYFPQ